MDKARNRAEMPEGTNNFLNKRTLEKNHKVLFEILRPNLSVLDIGCENGVITEGIAKTVFIGRIDLRASVAETRGKQMVRDGFISVNERIQAIAEFREWIKKSVESQCLYLLCVLRIK
jgi:2-polyprenyl-3-methyl-5-hydroxy-6-metoxy-1,4-benzoquinol methylase